MAKFDQADPRWIVSERADGTNVNAWHWQEKDCTAWSKRRLAQLFEGAVLVDSPRIVATGLDSLGGEAFLNNRKARLVASYELKLAAAWRGATAAGVEATGTIELPYLADENEDEDVEVRVAAAQDTPAAGELRDALLRKGGREAVRKLIATYVSELKSGAPLQAAAGTSDPEGAGGDAVPTAANGAGAAAAGGKPPAAAAAAAAGSGGAAAQGVGGGKGAAAGGKAAAATSRTTLELREEFYCRPSDMYDCFTNAGRICAFTRSEARAEPAPGGAFSWFGGGVTGRFLELAPPGRLALEWRFSSWADGCASRVEVALTEPEAGSTVLELRQTGIPEEDRYGNHDVKMQVEKGWQEQVFKRIKQMFGYGC